MNRVRCGVCAIFCLATVTARAAPSAATYAALPVGALPRLSPDGHSIVMIGDNAGRPAFVVMHLDGGPLKVFSAGDWTPERVVWKTDNLFLGDVRITFHRESDLAVPNTRLLAIAADGSSVRPIEVTFAGAYGTAVPLIGSAIAALLPNDPDHILMHTLDADGAAVARVNVRDGSRGELQAGRRDVDEWLTDADGVVRAATTYKVPTMARRNYQTTLIARSNAGDSWHDVLQDTFDAKLGHEPVGFSATDPDQIDILTNGPAGHTVIQAWSIGTGAPGAILAQIPGHDVAPILRDEVLIGYKSEPDGSPTYFDPAWQHDRQTVLRALGQGDVSLIDRTADGKRVLASVTQGTAPTEYWLLDRTGPKTTLHPVIRQYETIPPADVAPARWISYIARDGMTIPALLTLPPGAHADRLPFVVLPHGGPTSHDPGGFDWLAQFIASRGYGVLQPQFRGSTGFGAALRDAGVRNWGLAMQDDITDGTKYLIAQHLAAADRICMVGASYGGYAALEAVEKEPDLYRCAAAFAPVTNLLRIYRASSFAHSELNLPLPSSDSATLERVSPVNGVDRIRVPVLLVHGNEDFTVQVEQSHEMEYAMKQAGKSVQAVYLPDSDHFMSHEADRLGFLQALEPFLAANLAPR